MGESRVHLLSCLNTAGGGHFELLVVRVVWGWDRILHCVLDVEPIGGLAILDPCFAPRNSRRARDLDNRGSLGNIARVVVAVSFAPLRKSLVIE